MLSTNDLHSPDGPATAATRIVSIAYLVSQYPTLSMSFVLREVIELRAMGVRIDVASVNMPDRPAARLTAEEAVEAAAAYHLKGQGLKAAVGANGRTLITNFVGYWRGLRMVFRLGGLDLVRLFYQSMYFVEALMVGVWMQRKQHRHLHVHLGSQAATVGMYVRCVFGVGFSITVHGPDEFYDAKGQCLREKVAAADFICCISYFCRSQLMKFSPYADWHKLLVSRLGVDTRRFLPAPARSVADPFRILSVGRLVPAKGQHQLIDAVERLAQQGRRVRLHLVGAGPDEDSLRERVSRFKEPEMVVFEGPVNQDAIRAMYQAADVFCIASFAEGIPVVLMEAMAMGIPCLTTQIAGVPEMIRSGIDGLLVAPSDLDGLAEALAKLVDDVSLRERLGKGGRARILEHYDLRRNVEKLAAVFAERVRA